GLSPAGDPRFISPSRSPGGGTVADVALAGIHKSFGENPIVRGVDLEIRAGEFMVLVGPSGCGKTTLLRLIAGLERSEQGEIRIGGRRVNELPPRERDVGMVFQ